MTVGSVLGEAWRLYTKFFVRFFGVALIVFLVVNLLEAIFGSLNKPAADGLTIGVALITLSVTLIGTFWLQGALVYAVVDVRDGKIDSTIADLFERARPQIGRLLVAGFLAGIAIGVGFFLLVVPGLILLTWWCLIAPVIVIEDKSVGESFGRSRELVRGHGWQVLGVVVISVFVSTIASGLIQALFSFLGSFLRYWIGGTIASAVVGPFLAVALTVMFFRLREASEPAPPTFATHSGF